MLYHFVSLKSLIHLEESIYFDFYSKEYVLKPVLIEFGIILTIPIVQLHHRDSNELEHALHRLDDFDK